MFFHPCRDVHQAVWDPCSYRWDIWSKWEIELFVISIARVGDTMCLYDGTQWCSVCEEEEGSKNQSLRNPSDQFVTKTVNAIFTSMLKFRFNFSFSFIGFKTCLESVCKYASKVFRELYLHALDFNTLHSFLFSSPYVTKSMCSSSI